MKPFLSCGAGACPAAGLPPGVLCYSRAPGENDQHPARTAVQILIRFLASMDLRSPNLNETGSPCGAEASAPPPGFRPASSVTVARPEKTTSTRLARPCILVRFLASMDLRSPNLNETAFPCGAGASRPAAGLPPGVLCYSHAPGETTSTRLARPCILVRFLASMDLRSPNLNETAFPCGAGASAPPPGFRPASSVTVARPEKRPASGLHGRAYWFVSSPQWTCGPRT